MSNMSIESVKQSYANGKKIVCDAMDTAKNISIHPKLNASLSVKSKEDGESYFNGNVKLDKEVSLLRIIYTVLAVIAVFAAASLIINTIFSVFDNKKKCACKKASKNEQPETVED